MATLGLEGQVGGPRCRGWRTEWRGPSSDVAYYQPSSQPRWFLPTFPLDTTDSANKGFSCLSGAIPGPGAPTPCCRGCRALIMETAEARDPEQRGRENWKEGRQRGEGAGQGRARAKDRNEQTVPLCASRACPCPPPLGETLLRQGPFRWHLLCLHSFITHFLMTALRTDSSPLLI